jgi:hypothetical protein
VYLTDYYLRARKQNQKLGFVAEFFLFCGGRPTRPSPLLGVHSFVGLFPRFVVSDDKTKSWVRRYVNTFWTRESFTGSEGSYFFGDPEKFTRLLACDKPISPKEDKYYIIGKFISSHSTY